jgi:hypothetical protein
MSDRTALGDPGGGRYLSTPWVTDMGMQLLGSPERRRVPGAAHRMWTNTGAPTRHLACSPASTATSTKRRPSKSFGALCDKRAHRLPTRVRSACVTPSTLRPWRRLRTGRNSRRQTGTGDLLEPPPSASSRMPLLRLPRARAPAGRARTTPGWNAVVDTLGMELY